MLSLKFLCVQISIHIKHILCSNTTFYKANFKEEKDLFKITGLVNVKTMIHPPRKKLGAKYVYRFTLYRTFKIFLLSVITALSQSLLFLLWIAAIDVCVCVCVCVCLEPHPQHMEEGSNLSCTWGRHHT